MSDKAEVVDVPSQPVGLRVSKCITNETEGGSVDATVTIVGHARGLHKLVGEQVNIATTSGGRRFAGKCSAVTIKAGKTERKKEVSAKVVGPRELDELVGLQVTLEPAQGELPGTGEPATDDDAIRSVRPANHSELAVNPPKRRRGKNDEDEGDERTH